jgi:hypothetical protein
LRQATLWWISPPATPKTRPADTPSSAGYGIGNSGTAFIVQAFIVSNMDLTLSPPNPAWKIVKRTGGAQTLSSARPKTRWCTKSGAIPQPCPTNSGPTASLPANPPSSPTSLWERTSASANSRPPIRIESAPVRRTSDWSFVGSGTARLSFFIPHRNHFSPSMLRGHSRKPAFRDSYDCCGSRHSRELGVSRSDVISVPVAMPSFRRNSLLNRLS